jgi:hypothetical protein
MNGSTLSIMDEDERRYDVLPPWAWRRPTDEVTRIERKVAAVERLMRESERAFADDLTRLARMIARHRMNARALAAQLADDRAALRHLTEDGASN